MLSAPPKASNSRRENKMKKRLMSADAETLTKQMESMPRMPLASDYVSTNTPRKSTQNDGNDDTDIVDFLSLGFPETPQLKTVVSDDEVQRSPTRSLKKRTKKRKKEKTSEIETYSDETFFANDLETNGASNTSKTANSNPNAAPGLTRNMSPIIEHNSEHSMSAPTSPASKRSSTSASMQFRKEQEEKREKESNETKKSSYNVLDVLHRGTAMLKWPRKRGGFPHFKLVQISPDNNNVQWFSKNKSLKETSIRISWIRSITEGQGTEAFKKLPRKELEKGSFSIHYTDASRNQKTLDLVAKSSIEAQMWMKALKHFMALHTSHERASELTLDVGIPYESIQKKRQQKKKLKSKTSQSAADTVHLFLVLEKDLKQLEKQYRHVRNLADDPAISKCGERENVARALFDIGGQLDDLRQMIDETVNATIAKREVRSVNTDLSTLQEKIDVLIKFHGTRRRSLFG